MSTKVLVIGAGGYIGGGVARAFRRAGYFVYGVLRKKNEAYANLIKEEIVPILGDTNEPEKLKEQILKSAIIIDTVGYAPESPHCGKFFDYVAALKKNSILNYKTLYIFTSGIMTNATGERVDFPIDETYNPSPKDQLEMIPKKAFEDKLLLNTDVRPVVVRPGFVYGGNGGVVANIFFNVKPDQATVIAYGDLEKKWSWVHIDDLSDAFVKIAKSGSVVDHQVFNVAAPGDNPTFFELKYLAAKAAGWKGTKKEIVNQPLPKEETRASCWEYNVEINPQKAIDLLGWKPYHVGVIQEIDLYYQSWAASK